MKIVLLSGGSGKRLWPLSNDARSKQFLKVLTDKNGNKQSMAQRVFGQIKEVFPSIDITVATNISQVDSIHSQMGDDIDVVIEPQRRDTFPAIALSCAYLAYEKNVDLNETIIVLPVDPFTEVDFFRELLKLNKLIENEAADIALVGIKPTIPTSKYGYIVPDEAIGETAFTVSCFVEKPDEVKASELIKQGAYWNGGVFAFKLKYMMKIAKNNVKFDSFSELQNKYGELEKVSFDYKVVEKADKTAIVPFKGKWSDIGTWRTLTDEMPVAVSGNVVSERSKNTFVTNELDIPIITLGTKDLIIAASPDGILVSDLVESSHLKTIVEKLEYVRPMYEERRWGEYTVISRNENSLVKRLNLAKGKSISYQAHRFRDVVWVITAGKGKFVLDGETKIVNVGDNVTIKCGQKHSILAIEDLSITEVQIGEILSEADTVQFSSENNEVIG